MAPRPPPNTIQCPTSVAYAQQLDALRDPLSTTESEETWDRILHAILTLASLLRGNASAWPQETVTSVRPLSRSLNNCINSERSRLSGAAIDLITILATTVEQSFDSLIPLFLPTLLALCSRPNKVFQSRARQCILAVIDNSHSPSVLSYLAESIKDKSVSLRLSVAECALACLNTLNPPDLEREPRAREIEIMIRATATDASADVRGFGKKIFEAYKLVLPGRVDRFTDPLTPTIKKYLNIKPKPLPSHSNPSSRPPSAQSTRSNDGKLPALQFSSSTSSLKPSHAPATSAQRIQSHLRSMSSTDLAGSSTTAQAAAGIRHRQPTAEKRTTTAHRPGRTDMPPPPTIPNRSGAHDTGPTRSRTVSTESHNERLFQSDSMAARGPTRPPPSTAMHADSRPLRTQGTGATSGPRRVAPVVALPDQPVRSRTGPIRPATSMAGIPSARQDGVEMPQRVVGGARRVPRIPPLEPPAATEAKQGPKREGAHTEARPPPAQRPVRATASVESLRTTRTAPSAESRSVTTTTKSREVVAPKGKQPSKPVATKATEKAKPVPKPVSMQRPGASHARAVSSDSKGVTVKRGGHARSTSRDDRAVVPSEESKENEHKEREARQKADKQVVAQAAEVPLPPSPKQEPAPPPADVPLPPSPGPEPAKQRPAVPKVEITTDSPTTPDRPRDADARALPVAQTPISALVADIERGFLFTHGDPLSPAQNYADQKSGYSLPMLPPLRALRTSRLSDIAE